MLRPTNKEVGGKCTLFKKKSLNFFTFSRKETESSQDCFA